VNVTGLSKKSANQLSSFADSRQNRPSETGLRSYFRNQRPFGGGQMITKRKTGSNHSRDYLHFRG
jgi:hypothetical protein